MTVASVTQTGLHGLQAVDMAVQAIANNLANPRTAGLEASEPAQSADPAAAADDGSVGSAGPYDPRADQEMVALFRMASQYQIDRILFTKLPVHGDLAALPRPD